MSLYVEFLFIIAIQAMINMQPIDAIIVVDVNY